MSEYKIKKVAVLGTGVMGAQIAAHLSNAGINIFISVSRSNRLDASVEMPSSLEDFRILTGSKYALSINIFFV